MFPYFSYTGYMQQGIKRDPTLVIKLRATFMKVNKATFVFLAFLSKEAGIYCLAHVGRL